MATLAEGTMSGGTELAYIAALAVSGLILIIVAAIGFNHTKTSIRVFSGLVGLAMLGYGGYLFFGNPDSVWIFWYVFIVPIGLIVNIFKARRSGGGFSTGQPNPQVSYPVVGGQQPFQNAPAAYPQPAGYQPQPGGQQAYQPQPGYQGQPGYAPNPQAPQGQPGYPPQGQPGYPQAPQGGQGYPQPQPGYPPQGGQPGYPGQPRQ